MQCSLYINIHISLPRNEQQFVGSGRWSLLSRQNFSNLSTISSYSLWQTQCVHILPFYMYDLLSVYVFLSSENTSHLTSNNTRSYKNPIQLGRESSHCDDVSLSASMHATDLWKTEIQQWSANSWYYAFDEMTNRE